MDTFPLATLRMSFIQENLRVNVSLKCHQLRFETSTSSLSGSKNIIGNLITAELQQQRGFDIAADKSIFSD
jgi:hypothetical protein